MPYGRVVCALLAACLLAAGLDGCGGGQNHSQKINYVARHEHKDAAYHKEVAGRVDHGSYTIPRKRKPTARDSGTTEAVLFNRNVDFRFTGDIGFHVPRLSVTLKPDNPSSPVIFDNPSSFTIVAHKGTVRLDPKQLTALMNDYVFAYSGSPLRKLKVSVGKGTITLKGELHKGVWLPFSMQGPLKLKQHNRLLFKPQKVGVAKIPTGKLLKISPAKMDDFITIQRDNVRLIGNAVFLYADKLFPPPKLKIHITGIKLTHRGLILHLDDGKSPAQPTLPFPARSYMLVDGGDVKFERSVVLNALIEIVNANSRSGNDLDFCLYRYQDQLAQGRLRVRSDGAIHAFMRNYTQLSNNGEARHG